jgi:hypothetical protein
LKATNVRHGGTAPSPCTRPTPRRAPPRCPRQEKTDRVIPVRVAATHDSTRRNYDHPLVSEDRHRACVLGEHERPSLLCLVSGFGRPLRVWRRSLMALPARPRLVTTRAVAAGDTPLSHPRCFAVGSTSVPRSAASRATGIVIGDLASRADVGGALFLQRRHQDFRSTWRRDVERVGRRLSHRCSSVRMLAHAHARSG